MLLLRCIIKYNKDVKMFWRKFLIFRIIIDLELLFLRKKDCKDYIIMLGVFYIYVLLKLIICIKKL